jgi:hypothetical protein
LFGSHIGQLSHSNASHFKPEIAIQRIFHAIRGILHPLLLGMHQTTDVLLVLRKIPLLFQQDSVSNITFSNWATRVN